MAIESAVMLRRIARIACLVMLFGLLSGRAAMAQLPITFANGNPPPVTVGSVIPFYHGSSGMWSQVYSMKADHYGNILFLDSQASNLYELPAGAGVPTLILSQAPKNVTSDCTDLENSQSAGYWNGAIEFDAWNNLYIADRYGSTHFCRVPWNPATRTWTFASTDLWTNGPTYTAPGASPTPISPQDLEIGDDGTFYASSSTAMTAGIFKFTVDQSGNVLTSSPLVAGLEDVVTTIAVDHAGNVFFIENAYDSTSKRVTGIREIAAGTTVTGCDGTGSCESALPRIDDASAGFNGIKGITFDAWGNLYFNSTNDASYGGQVDGIFMIPNEGSSPQKPKLVWADTVMIAPISTGFPVLIDPRGWLWVETYGQNNWAPKGSSAPPCSSSNVAECTSAGMLIWKPGTAVVGESPTVITAYASGQDSAGNSIVKLTASNSLNPSQLITISAAAGDGLYPLNGLSFYVESDGLTSTSFEIPTSAISGGGTSSAKALATQTLYYSFSGTDKNSTGITPAGISLTQPGYQNFKLLSNNPVANNTAPAIPPCTAGTLYPKWSGIENSIGTYSWCTLSFVLDPQTAGSVEGELQLLDSSNNAYVGSNAYLNGVGIAPAASMISSAATRLVASGLSQPKQVAADALGNSYVAESALAEIEFYPVGSSSATGVNIGTNLTAPTGVAVDGVGNVFIGDSGSVFEVPMGLNGKLAESQALLLSGLGSHLNLAADASGDVFVADKDAKQVVEIPNPQTSLLLAAEPTLVLAPNAGFTGPSAIATDSEGNVWVADGSSLWEIGMPLGVPIEVIANGLSAPVTGLAVDPSGSVFVAGANGVIWIPYNPVTGGLNTSSTVTVLTGLGTTKSETPNSIAMDGFENIYATYGAGAANAGMAQVGIGGTMNFDDNGEVNPNVPFEDDAQIFNIGNSSLTFAAFSQSEASETAAGTYVFSGANATDFMAQQATENAPACGPQTATAPGGFCYLGMILTSPTATYPNQATGSVAAMSNAVNARSGINIAMSGTVIQDLRWASTTTVTVTPASDPNACGTSTGSVYPGCQTVTVLVTPQSGEPSSVGTPGGRVIVSVGSASGSLPKQILTLDSNGTASFTYSALQGGTYTVNALFGAEGTAGSDQNTCADSTPCFAGSVGHGSFTITPATPTFVVGIPVTSPDCLNSTTGSDGTPSSSCAPAPNILTVWAGNTYVYSQQPSWVYVSVKSAVGTPTGTVSFLVPGAKSLVPADPSQGVNGDIPINGTGIAAFSLAGLPKGVYGLTVRYNGDTNYAVSSTSGVSNVFFQIIDRSSQICVGCSQGSAPAAALDITAGTPAKTTLTLMPLVGFAEYVSLQCVNLPLNSECTFAYPNSANGTVSVGKTTPGTASTMELTISTNVPVNGTTVSSVERKIPWSLAALFGLGMAGMIAGRKRFNSYVTMIFLAAMLAGALVGVTACTNAGYSKPPKVQATPTPPGTYQVGVISYNPAVGPSLPNSLNTPPFTLTVTVH